MLHVRHRHVRNGKIRQIRRIGLIVALLCGLGFPSQSALAQRRIVIQPGRAARGEFELPRESSPAFITNREMSRRLKTARELFSESDYQNGVRYLQSILDHEEDWFVERSFQEKAGANIGNPRNADARQYHFSSLKHAAEKLLGALPEAGRNVYEQQVGIKAGVLLKEAMTEDDKAKLSEIARRYFHTKAGYEAVYRLGILNADHGESLAAALHFQRLKSLPQAAERFDPQLSLRLAICWDQAGLPEEGRAVLEKLKRTDPEIRIRLGNRERALFRGDRDPGAWLAEVLGDSSGSRSAQNEQWTNFRGNLSRNAASSPASPVGPIAWSRAPVREEEPFGPTRQEMDKLEKRLEVLAEDRRESKHALPIPAVQPLIAGEIAVFRTLRNVQAADLRTGEVIWKTSHTDEMLRPVLSHPPEQQRQVVMGNQRVPNRQSLDEHSVTDSFLTQRKWRDMTTGTMSCDNQRVYLVEEVGLADGLNFARSNQNDPFLPKTHNKLMAFNMKQGFAEWEAGGRMNGADDPLGGTFFLGPPLPIGGRLFCLGERKNEIRLMVLESSSGKLLWEQRLVSPPQSLLSDGQRRMAGLSPTFGHGVMICPMATGAVVAVDISRRMLLWAYQYDSTAAGDDFAANRAFQRRRLGESPASRHPESRWADSVPVVADGQVFLTPNDSHSLHCLDLSTGELNWSVPRGDGVYLAGVSNGLAIIVGRSQIRAVRAADGQDAWTSPLSIPQPAGRGFFTEDAYHLPLVTGEMATVDLKKGRITARSKLPGGPILGNLVSSGGRVVFQSADSVGAFLSWKQIQTDLKDLPQKDPDDADALALRGKLHLHRGDDEAALAALSKAYAAEPTEEVRILLVHLLMDQLRSRPAEFQARRERLRDLIRTSEESMQFLMLTAAHAKSVKARTAAFRDYLQLTRTLAGEYELHQVQPGHRARSDRWIQARIAELAAAASPEELDHWNRIVEEKLIGGLGELSVQSRLKILSSLPRLPAVESAKLAIAKDWSGGSPLGQTLLLKSLTESPRRKIQDEARLALAETYLESWRTDEAHPLIDKLGEKWPDGWRQKFADLKPKDPVAWPDQKLKATFHLRRVAVLPEIPIRAERIEDSPYAGWTFSLDQQTRRILARDENGLERWHWDVSESQKPLLPFEGNTVPTQDGRGIEITIHGHLAVVAFRTHFAVLDLIKREHTASLLWSQSLIENESDMEDLLRMQRFQRNRILGGGLAIPDGTFGHVTLLGEDLVVYQVGGQLTAADPLTGETLWTREAIQPGSRILGNRGHVLAVASDASSATIYRTSDGESVKNVKLPPEKKQVAFDGVNLIELDKADGKRILQCRDLLENRTRWTTPFPEDSDWQRVGQDELALLAAEGTFRVLSLDRGTPKVEAKIKPDPKRTSFHVLARPMGYVLLTDRGDRQQQPKAPEEAGAVFVDGPAYAFNRQSGELLWKTSIENQMLEKLPPQNCPVLFFNKRRMPGRAAGGFGPLAQGGNHFLVRVLDLRTGEILYKHNRLQNVSPWRVRIQPTRQLVTIRFYEGVIELELTNSPLESP